MSTCYTYTPCSNTTVATNNIWSWCGQTVYAVPVGVIDVAAACATTTADNSHSSTNEINASCDTDNSQQQPSDETGTVACDTDNSHQQPSDETGTVACDTDNSHQQVSDDSSTSCDSDSDSSHHAGYDWHEIVAGCGNEVIADDGDNCGTDALSLKDGFHLSDLVFSVSGSDLLISDTQCSDSVKISDWFCGNQMSEIDFDGSCISGNMINEAFNNACDTSFSGSSLVTLIQDQCAQAQSQAVIC